MLVSKIIYHIDFYFLFQNVFGMLPVKTDNTWPESQVSGEEDQASLSSPQPRRRPKH